MKWTFHQLSCFQVWIKLVQYFLRFGGYTFYPVDPNFYFAFFDQVWSQILSNLRPDLKMWSKEFVANFFYISNLIRSPFGWCWIDLYSLVWKICRNISIFQFWCAYQRRCDQVWTWLWKLSLIRLPSSKADFILNKMS